MSYPQNLSQYADFPQLAQTLIKEVEDELDQIWSGWRQKQRFDTVEYNLMARIKWLLKKHSLLTTRTGPTPTPRYWDVLVVKDSKNPKKCYAHPIIPANDAEDTTRNPPSPYKTVAPAIQEVL